MKTFEWLPVLTDGHVSVFFGFAQPGAEISFPMPESPEHTFSFYSTGQLDIYDDQRNFLTGEYKPYWKVPEDYGDFHSLGVDFNQHINRELIFVARERTEYVCIRPEDEGKKVVGDFHFLEEGEKLIVPKGNYVLVTEGDLGGFKPRTTVKTQSRGMVMEARKKSAAAVFRVVTV